MINPSVLIVEDNLIIAIDLQERLENFGCNVTSIVSTGEQAISKTIELKPDLIIMDVGLKGQLNGIEAGRKILEAFEVPIIYVTGNSDLLRQANIKEPSINKPFTDNELKNVITSTLSFKIQQG